MSLSHSYSPQYQYYFGMSWSQLPAFSHIRRGGFATPQQQNRLKWFHTYN
ncbi:hypothetical protein XIS1_900103 [Xenorhabdus innexi]|uniref:Uncharacterized protein n=1 Tax=Xenorhabdus innexi TaxID=290109 RepID=A0A1N6N1T6_9GAMM|nr:hypothetical protein XIS1_900103 [Xenorhabdus innexi]